MDNDVDNGTPRRGETRRAPLQEKGKKVCRMDLLSQCAAKYVEYKQLELQGESMEKARDLLFEIEELANEHLKGIGPKDDDYKLTKAFVSCVIGQIGIVCLSTNETAKAEEYLKKSLDSISDHMHPDNVLVSVQVRNNLGFLCCKMSRPEEAKNWLESAENLYKDFRKKCPNGVVRQFAGFFGDASPDGEEKTFEAAHTLTKFYLAQVYGVLKDLLKSAVYCHETLSRELRYKEYDPVDWALNCATLSQFFMERTLFKQARHHLAAASCVLDAHEEALKGLREPQEKVDAKMEELRHRSADVSRCWAKYGTFLLEHSKKQGIAAEEEEPREEDEALQKLWFEGLELSPYESQIADADVVAFEDAREVFLATQRHLNKAKEYYTLEDRASDHVKIVQDHSQLFRHLSAFETDEERQFKMMKKRVDMLETVLKELNPRYYMDLCRQLWFELGETYHDMMQIKFQKAKASAGVPEPQALKKINRLADMSAANFNSFLDSIKDKNTKELPDPLPEELLGPVLVAHFYLGRLHYKYVTHDKRKQIENTRKAHDCFKFLVDVCETSEKARSLVGEELNISRQMITLLQMKILQL